MPLLPWLPAARKKRFPVTKRSPKMAASPETNTKVSHDLQGIFGASGAPKESGDDKNMKKRSSDNASAENSKKESPMMMHGAMNGAVHAHEMQRKQKRDISDPDDDEEVDNENGILFTFPFNRS